MDHFEGVPFVVVHKVFDIFEKEDLGPVTGNDPGDIEEKSALSFAEEAVRSVQGIFLRYTCNGKGLAGETGKKYIVTGNAFKRDFGYISGYFMITFEIGFIGLLAKRVPLAGKNAFASHRLKS
jgi:hypothetical protein